MASRSFMSWIIFLCIFSSLSRILLLTWTQYSVWSLNGAKLSIIIFSFKVNFFLLSKQWNKKKIISLGASFHWDWSLKNPEVISVDCSLLELHSQIPSSTCSIRNLRHFSPTDILLPSITDFWDWYRCIFSSNIFLENINVCHWWM